MTRAALSLLLLMTALDARAQLTHRGASGQEVITQTVQFLDTWERGGSVTMTGARDVLSRVERRTGEGRVATVDLMLYGPWGVHTHHFEEAARVIDGPRTIVRLTTWRAVDVNEDGVKELVFIERSASVITLVPADGDPNKDTGPFFDDLTVKVTWLERTSDALLQHELEPDPDGAIFAVLAAHEFGGAVNASLQLMAGDWLFNAGQYEKARYRYQVAREWAEQALPGRDAAHLDLTMPLLQVDPDEPAFTWIQSVKRVGALPAWYRRH